MPSMKWYQAALIGSGAAAGLSILLYYLFRDDKEEEASTEQRKELIRISPDGTKKVAYNDITSEDVQQILITIIESQEKMKVVMHDLNKKFVESNYTFDEMYKLTREVEPDDPLEITGLTMYEFDMLLERFENDKTVQEVVSKLMAVETPSSVSEKIEKSSPELIMEIHEFMLEELKKIIKKYEETPNKDIYDVKTVTIVAQALVSAAVEKKYNFNTEELEQAVLLHHHVLANSERYVSANCHMQTIMTDLISVT